jgi:hypothetical protein
VKFGVKPQNFNDALLVLGLTDGSGTEISLAIFEEAGLLKFMNPLMAR